MTSGKLYLLPVPLGEMPAEEVIPGYNTRILNTLREFIAEDVRSARRHLKRMGMEAPIDTLVFHELGKHSDENAYSGYLKSLKEGKDMGLLSEAGCPGVADPGAAIVRLAHEQKIRVVPLTGPSSLLLALMASGSNGQQFRFHGYLPKDRHERVRKIRELERDTFQKKETQLFIETPFRNDALMEDLCATCRPSTLLCVASDITLPSEYIQTRSIEAWIKQRPSFHKRPTVFILCS